MKTEFREPNTLGILSARPISWYAKKEDLQVVKTKFLRPIASPPRSLVVPLLWWLPWFLVAAVAVLATVQVFVGGVEYLGNLTSEWAPWGPVAYTLEVTRFPLVGSLVEFYSAGHFAFWLVLAAVMGIAAYLLSGQRLNAPRSGRSGGALRGLFFAGTAFTCLAAFMALFVPSAIQSLRDGGVTWQPIPFFCAVIWVWALACGTPQERQARVKAAAQAQLADMNRLLKAMKYWDEHVVDDPQDPRLHELTRVRRSLATISTDGQPPSQDAVDECSRQALAVAEEVRRDLEEYLTYLGKRRQALGDAD